MVKPNIVAAGKMFPHAHTRPEFAEGVIGALRDVADDSMTELAVGERCGITIPTRTAFAQSGFSAAHARGFWPPPGKHRRGAKNPYFDPSQMVAFNRGYLGWRARVAFNRLMGKRYQKPGVYEERGDAAPVVTRA